MASLHSSLVALTLALAAAAAPLQAAPKFEALTEFPAGQIYPASALVRHPDGNFYGTSTYGGALDHGTVFRVSPSGTVTTLAQFSGASGASRGSRPYGELIVHPDGSLYGVTYQGGPSDAGVAYRVTPGGGLTILADFGVAGVGSRPYGALKLHSDGFFYGTTTGGGAAFAGTVFLMKPDGQITTLLEFTGVTGAFRGAFPQSALYFHSDGFFYGTARFGGTAGKGTVFRLAPEGGAFTTLVEFTGTGGAQKGQEPCAALVARADGSLYGTTLYGGDLNYGTVFRLTADGGFTTLVEFTGSGGAVEGSYPSCTLLCMPDGTLHGTTQLGGLTNAGTVFGVAPANNFFSYCNLEGAGAAGTRPYAGVVLGQDGLLYGTTFEGGGSDYGTVFRVVPGSSQAMTVAQFLGATSQGSNPLAALLSHSDGNLYGTSRTGGSNNLGTIFRMSPEGAITPLVEFTGTSGSAKGGNPTSGLVRHTDGNFYGTTDAGGASGMGTVYRLTPAGVFTTLVEFDNSSTGNLGRTPNGLLSHPDGNLYGTTYVGGTLQKGTIFRLTPAGVLTTLYEFPVTSNPRSALVLHPNGNLYGTTVFGGPANNGQIFRLTPAGEVTVLVQFTGTLGANPGKNPEGLFVHRDGNLYGLTNTGGVQNRGTVYRMTPDGTLTTLVEFTGDGPSNKGARPFDTLIAPGDGNFYGTTFGGGASDAGTVFRVTPAGMLTTLVEFNRQGAPAPGSSPSAGLALHTDGNLYGTTQFGGEALFGTAFRVRLGPTPQTLAAEGIQASGATLKGSVNPNGATTSVVFEYGTSPNALTTTTLSQAIGGGTAAVPVDASVTGLLPNTTYYFRVRGDNGEQFLPQRGAIRSFTTLTAGTNLVSLGLEPGVGTRLRWRGTPGQTYTIESADTLLGPWTPFSGNVIANGAGELEFVDATTPAPARRFYRNVSMP